MEAAWTLPKVFGAVVGSATVFGFVFKVLLNENYKNKEKIEKLKESQRTKALNDVVSTVSKLNTNIEKLQRDLSDYSKQALKSEIKVEEFSKRLEMAVKQFESAEKNIDQKIKDGISTKIHHITNEIVRVQERKKNGQ